MRSTASGARGDEEVQEIRWMIEALCFSGASNLRTFSGGAALTGLRVLHWPVARTGAKHRLRGKVTERSPTPG
ncbi:hypothetical protein [Raoultella sp. RIT712]|uniref:hypothetical protein n=1 Tax=Raoultella sp. RIT712 TaxID=2666191 RepID=UPI0012ADF3D5|nr:hypothetical protein [Raoultella sp. RIT712]MRT48438.1 hypothetical protein [Raoultella sp. RIT712]